MQLNLPQYSFKYRENRNRLEIFCLVRKKWLVFTPEEWVRQNVLAHLIEACQFPASSISSEVTVDLPIGKVRADIVVYNSAGNVIGVIECKSPMVELSDDVVQQVNKYHHGLQPQWVGITNGMNHFFLKENQVFLDWPMSQKH
jgi:hypothetical protein